ncbi:putative oxidoreductase [Polystyrenella longa]|uniref:Putative oxidoreductase n=1 Tax=Polystyrenella longa TaxID=2528007 RepID=A0A518CU29_9PLAN|nr:Gfo/Idh/MocA family oxidoreductase [Polystyrenella longa]QDU82736.1 putative oxidoreductase [Polystyrenella longa]
MMLRLGIVDFDSSHSIEFTRRLNQVGVSRDQWVEGARIVAGWPGDSRMAPERIAHFRPQIEACGVTVVESPEALLQEQLDGILILSLSGQRHGERALPFLEAGIPTYVDKPFTCAVDDAQQMLALAEKTNTLLFSSSGLRFTEDVTHFQSQQNRYGALLGCLCFGPAKRAEGNPGLFHYGIHTTELLFTLMGPGCIEVRTHFQPDCELVTAQWQDDRLATLRGNRSGSTAYGFVAFCEEGVIPVSVSTRTAYRNLCEQIVLAFETNTAPVPPSTTLEIVRFISASLESEQHHGKPIALAA